MMLLAFCACAAGAFGLGVICSALCFAAREDQLQYDEAEKVARRMGLG